MKASGNQSYDSSFEQVLHKRSDLHILRKIWHITSGSFVLYFYLRSDQPTWVMASIAFLIALTGFIIDVVRKKNRPFNAMVIRMMGPLMRRSEREGMTGLPFYALGCSLSLFFFERHLAILSIMFLIFSDPISSFFGVLYGKDKILPNKSLQGAVAGFFTCYLITLFYLMNTTTVSVNILKFSIIAGIIGSASELVSVFNVDDNLTIPVLSGLGMTLLNYFIVVYS